MKMKLEGPIMRVACNTGGGVFGYAEAITWAAVEPRTLERIDCFAGTSVGGAIALALAAGIPPSRIAQFVARTAPVIFAGRWWRRRIRALLHPRYPSEPLDEALRGLFGDTTCEQLEKPAIVCTHDLRVGRPRAYWTPEHPKLLLRDLARRTMAAHTYFARHQMERDGGVTNNDPSMAAILTLLRVHGARLHSIDMYSLGNGRNPTARTEENYPEPRLNTGILAEWINDSLDGASVMANREDAHLLLRVYGGRYEWFEFPDTSMDMDDPAVIDMIRDRWAGEARLAAHHIDTFFAPAPGAVS